MLLSRIADTSAALAATRSRLAKRELISAVLADATADDVEIVVCYLSGTLRQRRTGIGWKSVQQLPAAVAEPSLTVQDVDAAFEGIAALGGSGSSAARRQQLDALLSRATPSEQQFLVGLLFSELRQGALEAQVQEGLARAYGVPLAMVRRASMLLSSTSAAAATLLRGGLPAMEEVGLQVGTAVQPMLAASAPDVAGALERTGLPAMVDYKLDGIRVQVHRNFDEVRIFTRSLDEITGRLPEVADVVSALPYSRIVLDGEVLALRGDGRPEAFQVTASRTATQGPAIRPSRLMVAFFDLLHIDGTDLLDAPLSERLRRMRSVLPPSLVVPRRICDSADAVAAVYSDAVSGGFEGVVVKNLASAYAAGRRDSAWVKLKPRHTLDLLVTAVEWGSGRRRGWLSNLHLAARDPDTGEPVMLGKTFKGMTDEMLAWQTEHFLQLQIRRTASTVYVEPTTVVEIACDGLQRSSRYPGGVALRFARVLRYRPDKPAEEADTIQTVKRLAVG
jgi:DNA ligase-1